MYIIVRLFEESLARVTVAFWREAKKEGKRKEKSFTTYYFVLWRKCKRRVSARVMVDGRGCIEWNIVHCFVKNTFIYICDKTGEFNGGVITEEEETITHIHKAFAVSV